MESPRLRAFLICLLWVVIGTGACHRKIDPRPFCSVGGSEFDGLVDTWNALRRKGSETVPALHHEGRGNGTAPAVLRRRACAIGAVTEPLSARDAGRLEQALGGPPGVFAVAMEALVIIVPRASAIQAISKTELTEVFSEDRNVGPVSTNSIQQHSMAALVPFGVNSASDRYRWFKTQGLQGKNFASRVKELPGPLQLVDTVAATPAGIGYARPAEMTDGVRALPIRVNDRAVAFSESSAGSGEYPLARYFYLYVLPPGSAQVNAQVLDFIAFAIGEEGQTALRPMGLFPVPAVERKRNQELLARYRTHLSSR